MEPTGNDDPLIGTIVRLVDAPTDPRNGGFFLITEARDTPAGRRYSANYFLGMEPPAQPPKFVMRGQTKEATLDYVPPAAVLAPPHPPKPQAPAPPVCATAPAPPRPDGASASYSLAAMVSRALANRSLRDSLTNRRKNWNGAIIRCDAPGEFFGQYFRITNSWRNPENGDWRIDGFDPLPMRPSGERVYKYTAKTWDLPQASVWAAFPIFSTIALAVACILFFAVVQPGDMGVLLSIAVPIYFLVIGMFWFQNYEPVKGTQFAYLLWALSAAWGASRDRTTYGESPDPKKNEPEPFDYDARRREEREKAARAEEIQQAVAKALQDDRQKRHPWIP